MSARPSRRPRPLLSAMLSVAAEWRSETEIAVAVGRAPTDRSVRETLRQYRVRGWFERRTAPLTGAAEYRALYPQEVR